MSELHFPWIEISIAIPFLGATMVVWIKDPSKARMVCLIISGITLALTLGEYVDFISLKKFEAHDQADLFYIFFHRNLWVIDELNAPLLPLAALLCFLTVLATLRTKANRFSYHLMLVSESILISTLSCRNSWGIIVLLLAAIIPVWLELRLRKRCTRVFLMHMGLFAGLLVCGQLTVELGLTLVGGVVLTLGILTRTATFPLHCWMTDLFEKVTFATALLFVVPMTGAYAVMRLILPIATDETLQFIAMVSLFMSVYASGMALVQNEARRFFCYLFLSHSSLVLVGLDLATPIGLTGGLSVWLSAGLSLGGLGLTLRAVESRIGRISLKEFHGLYDQMPTLAVLFLMTGLASIGFPGTIGFIGMELLVEGAIDVYALIGMAVVAAAALNSIAILQIYFRIFTGRRAHAFFSLRARPSEKVAVLILTALIIGGGLFPQWSIASRYHAAVELIRQRNNLAEQASDLHQTKQLIPNPMNRLNENFMKP